MAFCCACVVTLLGFYTLLRLAIWAFTFVKGELPSFTGKGKDPKSFGKWAAVTGSTSGIGEAYAHELGKKGVNVVLIGRNQKELTRVSEEIQTKHKVQTRTIQIDLSKATTEDFNRVIGELQKVEDFGILVNNAGLSYDYAEYFADVSIEDHRNIIEVNMRAVVEFTHGVLPLFVKRKRGAIVNVSSITALLPGPLLATYAASKAFVDSFTVSLQHEYKAQGVVVQALTPGFVTTKMSKIRKSSITTPTAEAFARASLASLGAPTLTGRVMPYWAHYLQTAIMHLLPEAVQSRIVLGMHKTIRSKALAKRRAQ